MFVNFPHYIIPKICAVLSFIFNPMFVYLLISDQKLKLGGYRHLLVCFSFFNMFSSAYDILVPMCAHNYRYAFVVFISEGLFVDFSPLGQLLLSIRCGLITVTYAILHAHFVYRYLALHESRLIGEFFIPYGLIFTFFYCFCHMVTWAAVCEYFFYGDFERKAYVHDSFKQTYAVESDKATMVIALYSEGSSEVVSKSWIGVAIVSSTSIYSMSLFFILGFKIVQKLKSYVNLSPKTLKLQRQLFKALIVQTVIPICVSLMPSMSVWFAPVFLLDFRRVYIAASVAISVFPCVDPVAIVLFIPSLRRRLHHRASITISSIT